MLQTIEDRFWSKVRKTNFCWEWMASKTSDGYGAWIYPVEGKQKFLRAHRFSFMLFKGGLTKGKELNHICRNKICVRPDHLEELTRTEHMRKTPGTYGYKWAHRTHCEKGHALEGKNLLPFASKRGFRRCRECSIEASRIWRTANPEKMKAAVRNYKAKNYDKVAEWNRWYNEHVRGHTPRAPKPSKA